MTNDQIAKILSEIADFYEMKKIPWKPRAYEKAAQSIASLDRQVKDIYKAEGEKGLFGIPGVGQGIAERIVELLKTGKLAIYEKMKKKVPVRLAELRRIPGLGPRTVAALYERLGIRALADLKKALDGQKIRKLPGFGEKSEEQIRKALEFHSKESARYPLGSVLGLVEAIKDKLESSGLFGKIMVCGSYRRMQETVGDMDLLATAKDSKKAMEFFVNLREARSVAEHGETRSEIRLSNKMQVDLRVVPDKSWGAALQYFTGDMAHNIKLRKIANEKGLKLSEYGVFLAKKPLAPALSPWKERGRKGEGMTEEQVYKALGMDWIPPEMRTDSGEIEAALAHKLPRLIEYGSVKGDLQVQTNWTDGESSIEETAKEAIKLGREYIAITDHTKTLFMTGGLDEKKLERQGREIDKINLKFKNSPYTPSLSKRGKGEFRILKGAEVNILKDGSLDIADETLAKLDVVGVSVHSNFKMPAEDMTKRIVRALSNPNVDIFFHPTTRIIGRRPPIEFDFDEVLRTAKKYKVAMEIDAHPARLDLHDTLIRKAVEAGVKLVIDSDAHHVEELKYLHFGEAQARRGWAEKDDILNTKPVEEVLKYFAKK